MFLTIKRNSQQLKGVGDSYYHPSINIMDKESQKFLKFSFATTKNFFKVLNEIDYTKILSGKIPAKYIKTCKRRIIKELISAFPKALLQ